MVVGLLVVLGARPVRADGDRADQPAYERCATCHELDGNARAERIPRLAGQTVDYLVNQLRDFRDGHRPSSMQATAELLDEDELAEVARHFSKQTPAAIAELVPPVQRRRAERLHRRGDRTRGIRACASCHGRDGEGSDASPRLAGQHPGYLQAQLLRFKNGRRANDDGAMRAIAGAVTAPEIQDLARYFAGLGAAPERAAREPPPAMPPGTGSPSCP